MRVYELAKELGFDSKEFIDKLKELKVKVKSHLSHIDEDTAEIIRHEISEQIEQDIQSNVIETDFPLTVKDFAVKLGKKPSEVISLLFKRGKAATINQGIDKQVSIELARELGFTLQEKVSLEDTLEKEDVIDKDNLKPRPPIVTLMGHIDHGKTTILDYIRKSKIADSESGSITQHIAAYQVAIDKGKITFIDTPGHETFTAMRSRGANITDIVVIVIAADEGVKPQTEEAISHAKAAGVPIVIALNKMDKPNVQPDMVKQQLSKMGFTSEDWGGKTIVVPVSAKTGEGIDKLLEMIHLEAELLELKADFKRPALGVVVESKISKGLGVLSTVIIKQGVLKVKDSVVCGDSWGRVKTIKDDRGKSVSAAYPSDPVEIAGLTGVSSAGENIFVVPNDKKAQEISNSRKVKTKESKDTGPVHIRLEDVYKKMQSQELKQFNLIIKADVYGTLEAICDIVQKIELKEIELKVIHKSIGVINRSDLILAQASDALIMGFKVGTAPGVSKEAQDKGVQIKTYQVIYSLVSDIKAALEGLLEPHVRKEFVGRARVKQVFNLSKSGIVAGSIVEKGKISRNALCSVLHEDKIVYEGKIQSLKRFKNDIKEVTEGTECGIDTGYKDIKQDDIIEVFQEEITTRKIDI